MPKTRRYCFTKHNDIIVRPNNSVVLNSVFSHSVCQERHCIETLGIEMNMKIERVPDTARMLLMGRTWILIMLVASFASAYAYTRPPPRDILSIPFHRKHGSDPEQVHISLAGDNKMRVTWITYHANVPSMVEYGTSPGVYTSSSVGESDSYSYVLYDSGEIHHVVIGPLEANKIYFYRCGGSGPEYSFKTPPAQFPVVFAIVGDLGQTGWTSTTLEHIQQCNYDVHILPGDLSYADYQQHLWDSFGRLVEPLASARPWMVTEGNHEKELIPFFMPSFRAYNARWRMPFKESGSSSNLYYSFEVAGVHAVMLGSYTDYGEDSDQYQWLQTDLSNVNRRRTPWLIVVFHAPWYNSNTAHRWEGDDMMATMEPLLYAAKVDIVFAGHVHAYERSTRVYMRNVHPCGAVHITIGDGGNHEGLATRFVDPQPEWSVFREASFGHGELRVANATHAHWSWHRNDDDEPVKSDEVWINNLSQSKECIESTDYSGRKILVAP